MRRAAAVGLTVTLLALFGCGRDGDGRAARPASAGMPESEVTKSAFIEQSEAVCGDFREAVDTAFAPAFRDRRGAPDAAIARAALPAFEMAVRAMLEARSAIESPDDATALFDRVVATERTVYDRLVADARVAATDGDGAGVARAFQAADMALHEVYRDQRDYGMTLCTSPIPEGGVDYEMVPEEGPVGTEVTLRSRVPCPPKPQGATSTQIAVGVWSTGTRASVLFPLVLAWEAAPTAADGSWTVRFTVPEAALPGEHALEVRCEVLHPDCQPACPYGSDAIADTIRDRAFRVTPT